MSKYSSFSQFLEIVSNAISVIPLIHDYALNTSMPSLFSNSTYTASSPTTLQSEISTFTKCSNLSNNYFPASVDIFNPLIDKSPIFGAMNDIFERK